MVDYGRDDPISVSVTGNPIDLPEGWVQLEIVYGNRTILTDIAPDGRGST